MKIAMEITVARPITTMLILKPPYEVAIKLGQSRCGWLNPSGPGTGARGGGSQAHGNGLLNAIRSYGQSAMKRSPALRDVIQGYTNREEDISVTCQQEHSMSLFRTLRTAKEMFYWPALTVQRHGCKPIRP